MKKTISICFFAGFLLLYTFGLFLLWNPQKEDVPNQSAQIESETQDKLELRESMKIETTSLYYITVQDGYLVVMLVKSGEELFETNIQLEDLEESVQQKIESGLTFSSEKELYDFLESYSS